jgi:hypothetical protein
VADNLTRPERPKILEIFGAAVAYFATAKDVPTTLRLLYQGTPEFFRRWWQWVPGVSDSRMVFGFTLFYAFALLWILWRTRAVQRPSEEMADDELEAAAHRGLRNWRLLRAFRSFGLSSLRDWALERMGVGYYHSFKRPLDWKPEPDRTDDIDRIGFKDGHGVEYQYSAKRDALVVREHGPRRDASPAPYANETRRPPSRSDIRLLAVAATGHFLPWYLRHLLCKRPPSLQARGEPPIVLEQPRDDRTTERNGKP